MKNRMRELRTCGTVRGDLVSQFRLAPEERAWAGMAARRGPIDGCIVDPAEGISEHRSLPDPRADTGNSPVIHCEATFTGGAHGRFNRAAHNVSAKRIGKTVPLALTWVLGRGVQALEPPLRWLLPWPPRRGSIRRIW
jgi:hypothetical protein